MGVIRRLLWVAGLAAVALLPQNATLNLFGGSALAASSNVVAPSPKSPNIVLITLDTTRADRMGFLGSQRGLTPNLDVLAQESAVFTHAYSQAPLTSVSHATILTGTYPQFHGVIDFPMMLGKDLPYAPEILRTHGYHTAGFLGSLALDPAGGAPGFERGFDVYDANFHPEDLAKAGRYHSIERRGDEVVAHALAWLDQNSKGPFFLWVHLYDAHDPYDPPEPYKSRYASELYDGEIAYVDSVVGKLLRELKARGLYEGAMMAIMADHGESLGAHGEDTHGVFLYDETIRVPLVIKLPRPGVAGKRIENPVELADVLPTLLQGAGIAVPAEVQGQSLVNLMTAGTAEDKTGGAAWRDSAYAQADYAHVAYGWSVLQSWRTTKYLYVQAPRRELYDQTADPKAEHNLAPASPAVADTLAGKMSAFRQSTTSTRPAATAVLTPAKEKQLAALGYVIGAGNTPRADPSQQEADPKDRIETVNVMRKLNVVLEEERYAEAVPVLQDLIAKYPDITMLYFKLGGCFLGMKQYDKAVPIFRKAVELEPDFTRARINLGRALLGAHDYDAAADLFEAMVAKTPKLLDANVDLEIAYFKAGRLPEAIKECGKVLEFLPEDYGTYLILGQALAASGDLELAAAKFQKAAALRPTAAAPHVFLSEIYDRLGREADAEREGAEGERLVQGGTNAPKPE
jgi:choline-sulfatase